MRRKRHLCCGRWRWPAAVVLGCFDHQIVALGEQLHATLAYAHEKMATTGPKQGDAGVPGELASVENHERLGACLPNRAGEQFPKTAPARSGEKPEQSTDRGERQCDTQEGHHRSVSMGREDLDDTNGVLVVDDHDLTLGE